MNERFHSIEAAGIRLTMDLEVGHIRRLEIERDGRIIKPLHSAPWIDEADIAGDEDIAAGLRFLSGDFFCAPFTASDIEEAPGHGWPANSRWNVASLDEGQGSTVVRYELEKRVMGAKLIKQITLRDGHPFVYQRHIFEGGEGEVSAASHAMTRLDGGGQLSFSPKEFGDLPSMQQESDPALGHSIFATSERFNDLSKLPLADGSTVDIHNYPVASGHEDFVMLVEDRSSNLGWTAAVRADYGDVFFSLKNPSDLPVTFLWFSNGGRYYKPWNKRHLGVLGVEEARAYSAYGHAASVAPNPLSEAGIPTTLTLKPGGSVEVRHVIGGVPLTRDWQTVTDVSVIGAGLKIVGDDGEAQIYSFDESFLSGS